MEQFGIAAGGGLIALVGHWLITLCYEKWRRPRLKIEFGSEYPFKSEAIFEDGKSGTFINICVKNFGSETARGCKVFVRKIRLDPDSPEEKAIPSAFLMQTQWVTTRTEIWEIDIPKGVEFHANIASIKENEQYLEPKFRALNSVNERFRRHIGDFEAEIVVVGDNFDPKSEQIRFRRTESPTDLIPLT